MIIAITGTPGTGKSTVAEKVAKRTGYQVLELSKLIKSDSELEISVSLKEMNELVDYNIKDKLIIVSHLSHFITSDRVNFFIVLRCDPIEMIKRLKKRGYDAQKIYDNVIFEALDGTYIEAAESHENLIQLDNTLDLDKNINDIVGLIEENKVPKSVNVDYSNSLIRLERRFRKLKALSIE
jgi:adenylate kinase